ncbi:TPA: histidine--tRNA ligase [Candidatus Woesearchaeota archaeon]|jgi:histidyl-tRNA synthetase|nr:histidine--tRNA ligase [Candidatus Woesearchaeota archaeon]
MKLAKGTQDIAPQDKIRKNKVVDTLREVFELYGFAPLETPIIERYETLTAKSAAGDSSDAFNEVFKLSDQGKRKLGLRFDLTVPLARYVAMNPNLKMPFKRYAVGRVFRDGPIKLGRTREFWQMDVDTVGTKNMLADTECLALADAAFTKLGFDVVIKVNNRKLLNGILEQAGIVKNRSNAIISIDKLAKIGREGVSKELKERGFGTKQISALFSILDGNTTLPKLKKIITTDLGKEGIEELAQVFSYLKSMNVQTAKFDVSLARGLGYYTGTVFEVFLKKGKITSSIAAGGRYDDMVGSFMGGGRIVPAVGISFGIVPIMETVKEMQEGEMKTSTKVLVIPLGTVNESLALVQQLRSMSVASELGMGKKGVSKNLQYANALGIPFVVILGEDELAKNKVLLRDMKTGDEKLISAAQLVKNIQ